MTNKPIGIIIGISFIIFGIFAYLEGVQEMKWPGCTGTIKSISEIREYRNGHFRTQYRTGYTYLVNGKEFHKYQDLASRRKVAETITVHYDPRKPERATLDPQSNEFGGIIMAIVGLVVSIACIFAKPRRGAGNVDVMD